MLLFVFALQRIIYTSTASLHNAVEPQYNEVGKIGALLRYHHTEIKPFKQNAVAGQLLKITVVIYRTDLKNVHNRAIRRTSFNNKQRS